jgi:queuine tRNA-ribosyltransferase
LRGLGSEVLVANAFHLMDRPGADVIADLGGLHATMAWDGMLLTDSGGYQVFSLLHNSEVEESGVTIRSPLDGRPLRLGAREMVAVQQALDADIAMVFDHCPPLPSARPLLEQAVRRTSRWAAVAREEHLRTDARGQAQFGIVQGGLDDDLRARSAADLRELDFDGYAVGGLSVGETSDALRAAFARYARLLPSDRPRYVMGIGRPADIVAAVAAGFDLFDSVLPTRNGRHGTVFTRSGSLNLKNRRYRVDTLPIEEGCDCPACARWSRGALRHLVMAVEPLGASLCSAHNVRFVHRIVEDLRAAIAADRLEQLAAELLGAGLP